MLKIEYIDTTPQAKMFAEQIKGEPKTYFLQGTWGSGKTEYLKNVEKQLYDKYRFVYLKLWKPKDDESLSKKLFEAIFPKWSKGLIMASYVFIVFSILGSILLAIKGFFPIDRKFNDIALFIATIAVILTTLVGITQNKLVDIDKILMYFSLRHLKNTNNLPNILVIDDFDRLDLSVQTELYTIFNAVQGKTRIIFVGDLDHIKNFDNNYLGKIIDQKVTLPYSLNSKFIAQEIQKEISKLIKFPFDFSIIKNLFIDEKRTARDANQFLFYVENEFNEQRKNGRVQVDQELFIIYLYLFHREKYQIILDDKLPLDLNNENITKNSQELELEKHMNTILASRKGDPPDFKSNSSVYLVNEMATNHSTIELSNFLFSDSKRKKLFLYNGNGSKSDENDYKEFLYYIENLQNDEYSDKQSILEESAIRAMHSEVRHKPNELIKYVFKQKEDFVSKDYSMSLLSKSMKGSTSSANSETVKFYV